MGSFWVALLVMIYIVAEYGMSAVIYLFRFDNEDTGTSCEICSKLTINWRRSGVFIVNLEHIVNIVLMF